MLRLLIRFFAVGFVSALLCTNASGEVRLELELEKSTMLVNEPVVVQCFVVNDGDEAIEVNPGLSPAGGVDYQIAFDEGDFVSIQGYPTRCTLGPARTERLEPGEKLGTRIILPATQRESRTAPLLQWPGKYQVRAIARLIYLDPTGDYEADRSALAESNIAEISVITPGVSKAAPMENRMRNSEVLEAIRSNSVQDLDAERLLFEIAVSDSEYAPYAAMALSSNEIYKCTAPGMLMEAFLLWRDERLQRAQSWALIADQQGSPLQAASIELQIRIARMRQDNESIQHLRDRLLDEFPESCEAIRLVRSSRSE